MSEQITQDTTAPLPDPARAPMAVLMDRLDQAAPFISVKDPTVKDRITWLMDEATARPAAMEQAWFKTRVGYVVQDVERLNGTILVMDPGLRTELEKLALSSPGLRHEKLAVLVRETANLRPEDGVLAQDIRRTARQAVTGGLDVASAAGREQIDQLDERVRAAKAGEPIPGPVASDPTAKADTAAVRQGAPAAANTQSPQAAREGVAASAVPVSSPQKPEIAAAQAASPNRPKPVPDTPGQTMVTAQQVQFRGTLRDILASARPPEPATPPPWSNEPAPLAGRLNSYEQRKADQYSDKLVVQAQKAAEIAMRAVETLGNGPGSGVLKKIEQAAAGDPDGFSGVVAGMQPGGRYAQLRAEFNATMTAERAFASSYDRLAASAGQYAGARQAVAADIAGRGLDAAQLEGKFEAMDKAIGQSTAAVPGRESGRGLQQELAEKAAEFFRQLMDRVKTSIAPGAKPTMAPVAAPAPGMSMS